MIWVLLAFIMFVLSVVSSKTRIDGMEERMEIEREVGRFLFY